jgi:hypothetical protein
MRQINERLKHQAKPNSYLKSGKLKKKKLMTKIKVMILGTIQVDFEKNDTWLVIKHCSS